jgi:hypothetical protein
MPIACIKCKHFSQPGLSPVMFCKHPEALICTDPVTGATAYLTCTEMRNQYTCGVGGSLFEEGNRNTFFANLKNSFLN